MGIFPDHPELLLLLLSDWRYINVRSLRKKLPITFDKSNCNPRRDLYLLPVPVHNPDHGKVQNRFIVKHIEQ